MMTRIDYYRDRDAPEANSLVPGASAIVADEEGRLLLHRRSDNERWALPGGAMDIGETIAQCAQREVKEETGLTVKAYRVVGIYSDPEHVFAYSDGEVRQEFSVCFACEIRAGEISKSDESLEVRFWAVDELDSLNMHPSIRLRISHYLSGKPEAFIA
jgi:ADP-ribose pyrophosphatase YjhB (NUDIX family)